MMSRLGLHAQIRWQTSRKRYVNICHSMYFYLKHVWETHAPQQLPRLNGSYVQSILFSVGIWIKQVFPH